MNRWLCFLFLIVAMEGFSQGRISHQLFDELLRKYVDDQGMVNYKGLLNENEKFQSYLDVLRNNHPQKDWSQQEQLAYWINAYNAFTIELILKNYPVASIKDIGSYIQLPFVNSPWDIKFIEIEGETYDLNNLEHGIIRKQFDEPRIHFALVCAAVSCPRLRNEAYLPQTLDDQLTDAAKEFLADETKNEFVSSKKVKLSKLFSWYGGDFTKGMNLVEYLNQYSPVMLEKRPRIVYNDYNWSLNEQK